MSKLYKPFSPSFDAHAINETIRRALASAGLDTSTGPMHDVTETIRRAISPDGVSHAAPAGAAQPSIDDAQAVGSFETCRFSNGAGSRLYKLYVPEGDPAEARPVIVMLHGCTQSPDDFATGTRMNRLADEHGFLVVYPEQPAQANPSKCWNWFKPQDQVRDAGEPSLIAGIVGQVAQRHGVDRDRVFVAGLSAGAAMAVVLGECYPDLFAGVGAHSGLPYGSASDIPSAMAAMKGGRSGMPGVRAAASTKRAASPVPTIVFHGDRDHTVQQSNGAEIVRQAQDAYLTRAGRGPLNAITLEDASHGGRVCRLTRLVDGAGDVRIESWTVQGAGHTWSGGDARGSYADPRGPDASREMVRFFLALPRARPGASG
jgi:poly(hydroxyalkanoate) depolymerase family esterase